LEYSAGITRLVGWNTLSELARRLRSKPYL
jgi:hypothetical protein